ncbi:MAG: hypothetical protein R3229_16385 [Alphaproteobacteria bacterium]|nr:hypothetical protein [Alphaproteobacteria bacterium]
MANFLEQLVGDWYEYNRYFVRRNVLVGKRSAGGYECELDIVAFNPQTKHLVHIEPSADTDSWAKRELRYKKKFEAGKQYIPALFAGLDVPHKPDQIALLLYGSTRNRNELAGGKIISARDFMLIVREELQGKRVENEAVPEQFPILRGLQLAAQYWPGA